MNGSARKRRVAFVGGSLGIAGFLVFAFACTPSTSPVAAGGECFTASDCEPGLVCIPPKNGGARMCSSDLSQVVGRPPPDGAAGEAGEAGEGGQPDGPASDAPEDTNMDTNMPDTNKPDAAEAG